MIICWPKCGMQLRYTPTGRMHTAAQYHDIMVHLAWGNIQDSPIHPPAWEDGRGGTS